MTDTVKLSKIKILDKTLKQGFAQVPRGVLKNPRLTMQAKTLYALLLDYAWQKGSCFPGQDKLAEDLRVHKNTILKYLKELRNLKLIDWERRGLNKTNIYYILPLPDVDKSTSITPDLHSTVTPESQPSVNQETHGNVNKKEEEEYTQIKNTQSLTLATDNDDLDSFDEEAVALAQELDDEKNIKYYQKLINQKQRGEISVNDIQTALSKTRQVLRTDQVDGTSFLRNPAAWFVATLKKLQKKRQQKRVKDLFSDLSNSFQSKKL